MQEVCLPWDDSFRGAFRRLTCTLLLDAPIRAVANTRLNSRAFYHGLAAVHRFHWSTPRVNFPCQHYWAKTVQQSFGADQTEILYAE